MPNSYTRAHARHAYAGCTDRSRVPHSFRHCGCSRANVGVCVCVCVRSDEQWMVVFLPFETCTPRHTVELMKCDLLSQLVNLLQHQTFLHVAHFDENIDIVEWPLTKPREFFR